jgi:phage FluMu protein Com
MSPRVRPKGERHGFECMFCGHKFVRVLRTGYEEIRCPRCRESDVEIIA